MKCSIAPGSISSQKPAFFSLTLQSRSMIQRHTEIWKWQRSESALPLIQEICCYLQLCKSCSGLCHLRPSGSEPPSETTAPRYLKLVTVPRYCHFTFISEDNTQSKGSPYISYVSPVTLFLSYERSFLVRNITLQDPLLLIITSFLKLLFFRIKAICGVFVLICDRCIFCVDHYIIFYKLVFAPDNNPIRSLEISNFH